MVLVEGEVGIGDGWWLILPEEHEGQLDEQDHLVFETSTRSVLPQTIACGPGSGTSPTELLEQLVADLRSDPELDLTDLGPISGRGWTGHLFREVIDPGRAEFQLLGCLTAPDMVLNPAVRFIGVEHEEAAHRLITGAVHDPASRHGMNVLIRSHLGIA